MSAEEKRLRIFVCSATKRSIEDLVWCAVSNRMKVLCWHDGYLFCYEAKFWERRRELVVSDVCISDMPRYERTVEVSDTMPPERIPVVRASASERLILEEGLRLLKQGGTRIEIA